MAVVRRYYGAVARPEYPVDVVAEHSMDQWRTFETAFAAEAELLLAWAHCRVRGELRQRIEAEDLVQEVGVRAYGRYADFDSQRGSFRQWLFGFANRVWLEALREIGRDPLSGRHRRGGDSQLPGVVDSVTTISRRAANAEAMRCCRTHLDALDDDDRRLLVCVGLEGLGHAETALVLGIREDSCRKRWQRLRAQLQADPLLQRLMLA